MTEHATIRQVFGDHDAVDVLTARVVLPGDQLDFDEVVEIHRVIQKLRGGLDLLDGLDHELMDQRVPLFNVNVSSKEGQSNDLRNVPVTELD